MAKKNQKLGTGLEAIFGNNVTDVLDSIQNEASGSSVGRKVSLNINEIHTNPYQPRRTFDEEKLNELAQSIRQHGVFTPVLVRETAAGYELITGERRLRASKIAELTEIPAIIMEFDDQQMMEVALLENIQRENLNVIEEAAGYQKLITTYGYTQEQLATKVGKSREHIANTLRLLKLPKDIQKLVEDGKLSMGHVRPLITLSNERDMKEVARKAVGLGLSVRAVEQMVNAIKNPKEKKQPVKVDPQIRDLTKHMQKRLSTKVKISDNNIQIAFNDTNDLNRILEILGFIED